MCIHAASWCRKRVCVNPKIRKGRFRSLCTRHARLASDMPATVVQGGTATWKAMNGVVDIIDVLMAVFVTLDSEVVHCTIVQQTPRSSSAVIFSTVGH